MESTPPVQYKNESVVTLWKVLCRRLFSNNKAKRILFILLIASIGGFSFVTKFRPYSNGSSYLFASASQQNLLDGCGYVYIDLGTNIGVQIRKLYEPHLFPSASVLPLFKKIFGNHSSEVCSVGFEANPLHDSYLKEFESYCLRRNWRVKIFTSTAVSTLNKNLTFYTAPGDEKHNQWGASLEWKPETNKGNITVPSIDFGKWFKTTVLNRKMPPEFTRPRIMMKNDIEGHDSVVIANFILSGMYCSVDLIYGEHLDSEFRNAVSVLQRYSNSCKTELINMDDESYYKERFPFAIPELNNKTMLN